jgi:hypothetical protein
MGSQGTLLTNHFIVVLGSSGSSDTPTFTIIYLFFRRCLIIQDIPDFNFKKKVSLGFLGGN